MTGLFSKRFEMAELRPMDRMKIRPLAQSDKARLLSILIKARVFTSQEIDVAMELINIVIRDLDQRDYIIHCMVDDRDRPLGYICYGPTPMTVGTFDLYWIAVDPDCQRQGVGTKLLDFLDGIVRDRGGRMILADTSTIPQYEKTRNFYLRNGFKEVARIADYYTLGNDRVTFCRSLLQETRRGRWRREGLESLQAAETVPD